MVKISDKVKNRLEFIKAAYHDGDVVMGEILASETANYLTLEEAHQLYMLAQNYANGDKFYTELGDNPGKLVSCLDNEDNYGQDSEKKETEVSIWCRLGAYIRLPHSQLHEVFGECNQANFEKLDFKKLYENGKIEFNGDSYIPEESCYTTAPMNGERHSCPHCGGKLIPSVIDGYSWFCPDCDEDFCNVELKD